jgi:hypothetical protein
MKYTGRWMVWAFPEGGGSGISICIGAGPGSSWPFAPGESSEPGDCKDRWTKRGGVNCAFFKI